MGDFDDLEETNLEPDGNPTYFRNPRTRQRNVQAAKKLCLFRKKPGARARSSAKRRNRPVTLPKLNLGDET